MTQTAFIISSLIIILIPGTGVIYTVSTAMTSGKSKGIMAAFSCTLGIIPHLTASIVLTSLLMEINMQIFTWIRYAGVLYLFYLGIGMIRSKATLGLTCEEQKIKENPSILRRGILMNLLNPKVTLFIFSFIPQYVEATGTKYIMESIYLGLIFMVLTMIVFSLYAFIAGTITQLTQFSARTSSIIQKIFGLTFLVFAILLLTE